MTNEKCMAEQTRVAQVVRKFMNVAVKEFRGSAEMSKKYFKYIADGIIPFWAVPEEEYGKRTYLELACLIDCIGEDEDRFWDYLLCLYALAYLVLEAGTSVIPVRMFVALPAYDFVHYMHSISPGSENYNFFDCLSDIVDDEGLNCTIKEYLTRKMDACRQPWRPGTSISDYKKKITEAYTDMGDLLIGTFEAAFPDMFDAESIVEECQGK